jgi:hypothetical protein
MLSDSTESESAPARVAVLRQSPKMFDGVQAP